LTFPLVAGLVAITLSLLHVREQPVVVVAPPPAPAPPPKLEPVPAPAPPVDEVKPPAPVVVDAPVPAPVPSHPNRPVAAKAPPAAGGDALLARMNRLEARLRRSVEPGEEPDPSALVLLKKLRLSLATSRTPEEHKQIEKSVDDWERTFLPGGHP
jgi:hypothetical protein